jgi:hypothetical protein
MTVGSTDKPAAPPYLSYVTFRNFLDSLKQGIPQRIDASTMPSLSGQSKALVRAAFRYMGLTDTDEIPTSRLQHIVDAEGKEREDLWAQTIREAYSFIFNDPGFDLTKATKNQFHTKFVSQGLAAETARKAEVFFLSAARDAALPVSTYITKGTRPGRQSSTTRSRNGGRRSAPTLPDREMGGKEGSRRKEQLPQSSLVPPSASTPREMMLRGLFEMLPPEGQNWTQAEKQQWFKLTEAVFERFVPVREERTDSASKLELTSSETNSV